jgi:hypothetical protein
VSEASVYPRLRGYLATLRLPAAAEALPGLLDTARAEQFGHTAYMERLLAIEGGGHHRTPAGQPGTLRGAAGSLASRRL